MSKVMKEVVQLFYSERIVFSSEKPRAVLRARMDLECWYKIEWLENGDKFLLDILAEDCRYRFYGHLKVIRKI